MSIFNPVIVAAEIAKDHLRSYVPKLKKAGYVSAKGGAVVLMGAGIYTFASLAAQSCESRPAMLPKECEKVTQYIVDDYLEPGRVSLSCDDKEGRGMDFHARTLTDLCIAVPCKGEGKIPTAKLPKECAYPFYYRDNLTMRTLICESDKGERKEYFAVDICKESECVEVKPEEKKKK